MSCQVPDVYAGATRLLRSDEIPWVSLALPWWPRHAVSLGRIERAQIIMLSMVGSILFSLALPLLRMEYTCVFWAASRSTFRTRSPCFLPQAECCVLGTRLPEQGREDIHIFPTPFFSLVDISRCASSRLAKHKQAFRLTGS